MLRRMKVVVCAAGVLALALWLSSPAAASLIVAADPVSGADLYTIPTTTTDWLTVVAASGGGSVEKAGATRISFTAPILDGSSGYPDFAYSDGDGPVAAANQPGNWAFGVNGADTVVTTQVGVGAGQVLLWAGADVGEMIANLVGTSESVTTAFDWSVGPWKRFTIDYSSTQAQNLVLTLHSTGSGTMAGFFAVTLTEVPEPSTVVLLAMGLIGLLCYAWRKQK